MKTLIFDFDGTLADSFELVIEIAYELTGMPRQSDDEVNRLRHLPLLKAVREMHIPLRLAPRFLVKGRQKMLERIHEVHPFPGIPEVLKELHANGYHLLVTSSNSEHNVRAFLRTNELESYFDGVYGGASLFNKASSLKKVIKRNKLDAGDCFYVGDEVRDIVAATKVGMEPV
jgi:phosphoglycolate phosphatase-like HAD superfamily hydrolase